MVVSRTETTDSNRSRREQRRERELELRRADVLAAATAEFAEKGFEGAQMSALAARAEVALGTLYSLFASKEQLFQAVQGLGLHPAVIERLAGRLKALVAKVRRAEREMRLWGEPDQGRPAEFQAFFASLEEGEDADLLNTPSDRRRPPRERWRRYAERKIRRVELRARWLPLLESLGKSPEQLAAVEFRVTLPATDTQRLPAEGNL